MQDENLVATALDKIDRWLKATGTKDYKLGSLACANVRAVPRIRDKSASIETLEAVLRYIDDHPAKGGK